MNAVATFVADVKCGDRVFSEGLGAELIVNSLGYGKVSTEAVLSGEAKPIEAVLTQDGRGYIASWAGDGESSGDAVYVERWTAEGRVFHGWIDRESRKIVQTG